MFGAPFRVSREAPTPIYLGKAKTAGASEPYSALARVAKMIPAEVVGVYLSGRSIAAANDASGQWALLCLVMVIGFRFLTTRDTSKPISLRNTQWDAVAYAAISFCIWVYAMGDRIASLAFPSYAFWASLLAIAWPVIAAQLVLITKTRPA